MASQTIAHPHGNVLANHRHRLHFAVAYLTENPGIHMRPVIEINMIRQRMDPLPPQRFSRSIYGGQTLNIRRVRFRHFVAIHAFFNRRNSGNAGL
jgi:hypothetical protein